MRKSTCVYCNKPIRFVKGNTGHRVWTHCDTGNMRCDGRSRKSDLKGFEKAVKAVPMLFNEYVKLLK